MLGRYFWTLAAVLGNQLKNSSLRIGPVWGHRLLEFGVAVDLAVLKVVDMGAVLTVFAKVFHQVGGIAHAAHKSDHAQ